MHEPTSLGQVGLSVHTAAGAAIATDLERPCHKVSLKEAANGEVFRMLGAGEVDLVYSARLADSQTTYIAPFEGELIKLGTIYREIAFGGATRGVLSSALVPPICYC